MAVEKPSVSILPFNYRISLHPDSMAYHEVTLQTPRLIIGQCLTALVPGCGSKAAGTELRLLDEPSVVEPTRGERQPGQVVNGPFVAPKSELLPA